MHRPVKRRAELSRIQLCSAPVDVRFPSKWPAANTAILVETQLLRGKDEPFKIDFAGCDQVLEFHGVTAIPICEPQLGVSHSREESQ